MSEMSSLLQIKGLRDGLLITLGNAAWGEVRQALLEHVHGNQAFFQGARLALDVGPQVLKVLELSELRDQLSEQGISLWAVLSSSQDTEKTAQLLGLATRISRPRPAEYIQPAAPVDEQAALWLNRTLRSGNRVEYPGHVVVFGDVNPGAEIVSGGSVLVWGRLRGTVHAGAQGDQNAYIAALELSPVHLRIADVIAAQADIRQMTMPVIVVLKDGCLVTEPWQPG